MYFKWVCGIMRNKKQSRKIQLRQNYYVYAYDSENDQRYCNCSLCFPTSMFMGWRIIWINSLKKNISLNVTGMLRSLLIYHSPPLLSLFNYIHQGNMTRLKTEIITIFILLNCGMCWFLFCFSQNKLSEFSFFLFN